MSFRAAALEVTPSAATELLEPAVDVSRRQRERCRYARGGLLLWRLGAWVANGGSGYALDNCGTMLGVSFHDDLA
jgi:hypothetical protein